MCTSPILVYEEYTKALHGNQKYILLLSNHLKGKNIQISLALANSGALSDASKDLLETFVYEDIKPIPLNVARKILWLRRLCKDAKVATVFCNNERSFIIAKIATIGLKVRLVWYIKNALVFWPTDMFGSLFADKILLISEKLSARKGFLFNWIASGKKTVMPIGVPLQQFKAVPELNADGGPLHILVSAALTPMKGFDDLLSALELLDQGGFAAEVRIIGATPKGQEEYEQKIRNRSEQLRNVEVKYLGWKSDVVEEISWSHVNILPSRSEGVPRSIIEAMAAGRAVIATNVGGVPEVVTNQTGIIVPVEDPRSLADAILHLDNDREKLKRMGQIGREVAISNYSIESHVQGLIHEFNQL